MDKFCRFFHHFPLAFQHDYKVQVEYPFEIDDYFKNGVQKSRRSDVLVYTPTNIILAEMKSVMLTPKQVTEVVVERRYLQRFEEENPDIDVKFMFLAPQIQPAALDLIILLNAALKDHKYYAVPIKRFVSEIVSRFNHWCNENRHIVSENRQAMINKQITEDCAVLFMFE